MKLCKQGSTGKVLYEYELNSTIIIMVQLCNKTSILLLRLVLSLWHSFIALFLCFIYHSWAYVTRFGTKTVWRCQKYGNSVQKVATQWYKNDTVNYCIYHTISCENNNHVCIKLWRCSFVVDVDVIHPWSSWHHSYILQKFNLYHNFSIWKSVLAHRWLTHIIFGLFHPLRF